jgi:hypothetical protein
VPNVQENLKNIDHVILCLSKLHASEPHDRLQVTNINLVYKNSSNKLEALSLIQTIVNDRFVE